MKRKKKFDMRNWAGGNHPSNFGRDGYPGTPKRITKKEAARLWAKHEEIDKLFEEDGLRAAADNLVRECWEREGEAAFLVNFHDETGPFYDDVFWLVLDREHRAWIWTTPDLLWRIVRGA